jgi:3-methyladenine DNA glycosylase AlkD
MTLNEVLADLKANGNEQTKKTFFKHGAREPYYGVLTEHLKKLQKKIKKDQDLALQLYDTGISDAMYLAGLICDPLKMTKKDLNHWAEKAYWYMISEYTVPPVAAESPYGYEIALEWIKSDKEMVASAGWATLSAIIARKGVEGNRLKEIRSMLSHIPSVIHTSQNRVRYTMNGFVISATAYISDLYDQGKEVAAIVGKVYVDMGGTACKVPDALSYIEKVRSRRGAKAME